VLHSSATIFSKLFLTLLIRFIIITFYIFQRHPSFMRSQWQSRPSPAAEIITTSWWLCLKNCIVKNRSPLGVKAENIWVSWRLFRLQTGHGVRCSFWGFFDLSPHCAPCLRLILGNDSCPVESVFVREDFCPYCFYRLAWASHFCFPHGFPGSRATSCTPQSTSCPEFPQAIPCEFEGGKNQMWMWLGPTKPSWKCK